MRIYIFDNDNGGIKPTDPVLSVGQGADPGAHLEVHLLVMNLYIAAARPVVDVLLAADPGVDGVP